jgi:hypothetical protein
MTRFTLIIVCILLGLQFGCKTGKSTIAQDGNKHVETSVDTLLFQAVDLSVKVVGKMNLEEKPLGRLQVNVPVTLKALSSEREDSLISIAYWIGVGETPNLAYKGMEEEVPQEWSQPGISAPLAAYIQGYPVVLSPNAEHAEENQIRFDFVDSKESNPFAKDKVLTPLIPRAPNQPNFGIVSGAQLQSLKNTISQDPKTGKSAFRFNLAYANQHRINSCMLQLKVVALYEVGK